MISSLRHGFDNSVGKYPVAAKIVRYIIAGGSAAVINIGLLYVFTEIFHTWYVTSEIIAFAFAFVVSFILQKFWTFEDKSMQLAHQQLLLYFVVAMINLVINALLIYLFVEYLHVHYILSQIIIAALVAIESYFVYQIFIFKKKVTL